MQLSCWAQFSRSGFLHEGLHTRLTRDAVRCALLQGSHDGYYPEMDAAVKAIQFCRVKQLYFPYSVHLFNGSYPAFSPGDCSGAKSTTNESGCFGQPDTNGHFRRPLYVSLKVLFCTLLPDVLLLLTCRAPPSFCSHGSDSPGKSCCISDWTSATCTLPTSPSTSQACTPSCVL